MYKFEETTLKEASAFAEENGIFQQTEGWAKFRKIFKADAFIGKDDGGKTVLSCIVYRLPVYLTTMSIGYITRGFVCDYSDKTLLSEFTEFIKGYMDKKHIVYLLFDPWCDRKINFEEPKEDIDAFFKSLGFEESDGMLNPKTNYRLHINKDADRNEEEKRIYDGFSVRLKNDIQLSHDRGATLEVSTDETLDRFVEIFYDLLVETTAKKGFGHRNLDYYKGFAQNLNPKAKIYLYKYDSQKDILYTEKVLKDVKAQIKNFEDELSSPETTDKKKERIQPKLKEAYKQLNATEKRLEIAKKYSNNPYLSASFFIKSGSKAYNFYGANSSALRELKLTANYWDMIKDSLDGKVETFNMGGTLKLTTDDIKKDPMYELYQYKCMYGGEFVEMPGEYVLIHSKKFYDLLHKKLNYFRRIIFRF